MLTSLLSETRTARNARKATLHQAVGRQGPTPQLALCVHLDIKAPVSQELVDALGAVLALLDARHAEKVLTL